MIEIWPESGTTLSDQDQRGSTYDLEWASITSSRESACRNTLMPELHSVKGNTRLTSTPVLCTVSLTTGEQKHDADLGDAYHTPTNSTLTSREKVCLNPAASSIPSLSVRLYALYANPTCWRLSLGNNPTFTTLIKPRG